jgi:hypothetical protein
LDIVTALQGMEMTKKTKALLMNIIALATLAFFFFKGTPLLVLLISGVICLVVLNVALIASKART